MLMLIAVLFVASAAVAAVEYRFWMRHRSATDPSGQNHGRRAERPERRVSLVIESLASVGAILVLAGSVVLIGQHWLLVTDWGKVGILAGVAIGFLIAGFLVRWFTASATQPLTELMWCASAGSATGAAAIAAAWVYWQPAAVTLLIASGTAAIYSIALWLMCRREMLLFAAFAGLVGALCGAIPLVVADATPWLAAGLGLWLIGLAWIALGWRYPEPLGTSITVGAVLALVGPVIALHQTDWAYLVGIVTAVAVMAVSVPLRNVVLMAFGSFGLLGYITAVVVGYAGRWVGVPESLVIIGLALIAIAIVTVRVGRANHRGPRAA